MLYTHYAYADLEMMVQQFKYIRSINFKPWKSIISREVYPGPKAETDEDIRGIFVYSGLTHN
jgi:hypothetical protein